MTDPSPRARIAAYLDRLRDLLPARRADAVVHEVSALLEDRLEGEGGEAAPGAVDRALAALGSPEAIAGALSGSAVPSELATRRAFGRVLPIVFVAHLVLAFVLTMVGAGAALVPGIVGALPTTSAVATGLGVLGVFLVDVGIVAVFMALLGRERVPALLHRLRLEMPGTRRDAALTLVLLALVAVIVNVASFRDALFALGTGEHRAPILTDDVVRLLPIADAVLALFALRHALLLVSGHETVLALAVDAAASAGAVLFAVLVMTRDAIVRVPANVGLTEAQATTFADLILRIAFVVCLLAAVLFAARGVRRLLRIRELVAR